MKRIITYTSLLTIAGALALPLGAQNFDQVSSDVDAKLEASLKKLADVRETIQEERVPLSTEVAELESQATELRREHNRLLKIKDSRTIDLSSLERQVSQLQEQSDFVNRLLNEFIEGFEQRIDKAENPLYAADIKDAKLAPKNANLSPEEKRDLQVAVVESAMDRMENLVGGHTFEGAALSPEGVLQEGTFAKFGPTVFFTSNDKSVYGLVETQLNAADPVVVALPETISGSISNAVSTGSGALPFDATLGKAIKVAKAKKSLMAYVEDGGQVGYVIIGLGIIAILLAVFKCFEIFSFKVAMPKQIDELLDLVNEGKQDKAQEKANEIGGTAGEMLAAGVINAEEKRGILEEMMFERILKARPYLERFLPFLAITAAAAPLLGLLGTVIGMIKTFQLITIFGTGDAKSLSSGISEALVTTALGLIVAIPTLILHGMLSRMAKRKLGLLEQGAVAFVNGVISRRHEKKD
ncbi:MotA/TolQ/ExbB proton channel family protein [Cerasicoccus fimbriatus]|uniref:MotA/TolQ/ExbB proton channel family protein n=1 Tax=Cerasicoccus fimbriatus TaxID=3014554 RepID=UPI0022B409BE|nr:MotA/TolQ/ExbB proton channel family protein [Cerasicoccus sp. TK19100]